MVLHPEQGWYLLCNHVVRFDDGGELLPDGTAIRPYTSAAATTPATAGHRNAGTADHAPYRELS